MSIIATVIYKRNQELSYGESYDNCIYAIEEAIDTVPDIFLQDMDNLQIHLRLKDGSTTKLNFANAYNKERQYF